MKKIITVLCIISNAITYSQTTIQIIDKDTKESIEYSTLLLPEYEKSFITNENGKYTIDTNKYKLPTKIIAEHFAFENKEFVINTNTNEHIVELTPKSEILDEILIPANKHKIVERIYGRTAEGSGNISGNFQSYNDENKDSGLRFGMILNTNNKLKRIKKIHWYISNVEFNEAIYSIEFYEVKKGKPSDRISHPDIRLTVNNKTLGWNIIDVNDLDIYIEGNKKIAAVIKTLKMDLNNNSENNYLITNVGFTMSNGILLKDSEYTDWTKLPFNYPFYITVDSYE